MFVVGRQSRRDLFADKSCFMPVLWTLNQNVESKKGLWMICYTIVWENIIIREQSWCVQNQSFLVWMTPRCISCHFSRFRSYYFTYFYFHLFIISLCNAVVAVVKKWQKYIRVTNSKMYFTFGTWVIALTCIQCQNCNHSNSLLIVAIYVVMKGNGCRLLAGCNICSDSVCTQWCNIFSVMVLPLCFVLFCAAPMT